MDNFGAFECKLERKQRKQNVLKVLVGAAHVQYSLTLLHDDLTRGPPVEQSHHLREPFPAKSLGQLGAVDLLAAARDVLM